MTAEHSHAKPDLSPSQENSVEDSRKPVFKIEKVLSIYVPVLQDLYLWLRF